MRPAENKMSLSHNFFPSVWHFFICFCGNTDVALDDHSGQMASSIFSHRSGTFFICFCGNTDVALDDHSGQMASFGHERSLHVKL